MIFTIVVIYLSLPFSNLVWADFLLTTIDIGEHARDIAYDPVHKKMYVTNGERHVIVIDTDSNEITCNRIVVGQSPSGIAYDPVYKRMFVSNFDDNTVRTIDTTTNKVTGYPILVGDGPRDLAYDPVHKRMYVVNGLEKTVSVIDTISRKIIGSPIKLDKYYPGQFEILNAIAYDPVHKSMYVTNQDHREGISIIDTNTNKVIKTIADPFETENGYSIWGIAYDPFYKRMYVNKLGGGKDYVSIIDTNINEEIAKSALGNDHPNNLAYDPVHKRMFVTTTGCCSGEEATEANLKRIDTTTFKLVEPQFPLPNWRMPAPKDIAYDPANQRMYVTDSPSGLVSVFQIHSPGLEPIKKLSHIKLKADVEIMYAKNEYKERLASGDGTISTSMTFAFAKKDHNNNSIGALECSVDGSNYTKCNSPFSVDNIKPGGHVFQVRSIDKSNTKVPTPALFPWMVFTLPEGLKEIENEIRVMNLPKDLENRLKGQLHQSNLSFDNSTNNNYTNTTSIQ